MTYLQGVESRVHSIHPLHCALETICASIVLSVLLCKARKHGTLTRAGVPRTFISEKGLGEVCIPHHLLCTRPGF